MVIVCTRTKGRHSHKRLHIKVCSYNHQESVIIFLPEQIPLFFYQKVIIAVFRAEMTFVGLVLGFYLSRIYLLFRCVCMPQLYLVSSLCCDLVWVSLLPAWPAAVACCDLGRLTAWASCPACYDHIISSSVLIFFFMGISSLIDTITRSYIYSLCFSYIFSILYIWHIS